jgi:hypothetical protein
MRWVRVHTHYDIWAANGPAPTFCITSDDDGEAFIEIAKTPELLFRPVSDTNDLWNCYFSQTGSSDSSVAAETINIVNGRADYTLPQAVWEQMRSVASNTQPELQGLYYRVRARPSAASSEAYISHTDGQIQAGQVPFINVIPLSGDLQTETPVPDTAAVQQLDWFSKIMLAVIQLLPDSDPGRSALNTMLTHPTYEGQSSPRIRAQMLKLFVYAGGNGRQLMEKLLDMRVAVGSRSDGSQMTEPGLFYRDERNEGTTLDHLLATWNIRLDKRIPLAMSEVIYEVMQELVDPPGQVNQGAAGTCAATSIQTYTIIRNPAEYARWCRYILDKNSNHRVRLANGDWMQANPEAFDTATWQNTSPTASGNFLLAIGRTYSERGIQAAVMDYANFRLSYNPETDRFQNWLGQAIGSGLWFFEISRALEAIFNQSWVGEFGGGGDGHTNNPQAANDLVTYFNQGGLPCVIGMSWGTGAHAVLGLRVENDRIIFKNPQYRGSLPLTGYADGANLNNPTRRIHDVSRSEESMSLNDLRAVIWGFCRESSAPADLGYTLAEIPLHLRASVNPTL